jgi:hypothetical protein
MVSILFLRQRPLVYCEARCLWRFSATDRSACRRALVGGYQAAHGNGSLTQATIASLPPWQPIIYMSTLILTYQPHSILLSSFYGSLLAPPTMLPHLANNDSESGQERPSLPSIRELFGGALCFYFLAYACRAEHIFLAEQLSKPVHKRPSPFSLADLGSSLPSESRSSSPGDSQGSYLSSTLVRRASCRPTRDTVYR